MSRIPDEQRAVALDLVYDRRRYDDNNLVTYDPLQRYLELFEGWRPNRILKPVPRTRGAATVRATGTSHH